MAFSIYVFASVAQDQKLKKIRLGFFLNGNLLSFSDWIFFNRKQSSDEQYVNYKLQTNSNYDSFFFISSFAMTLSSW
jgi:hypothetical protein